MSVLLYQHIEVYSITATSFVVFHSMDGGDILLLKGISIAFIFHCSVHIGWANLSMRCIPVQWHSQDKCPEAHWECVRSTSFKDSNSFRHTLLQKAWTQVPYHQQISNFDLLWTTNALLSKQALPYPTEKTKGLERVNRLSRKSFHPLNQNWSFERVTQKSNCHSLRFKLSPLSSLGLTDREICGILIMELLLGYRGNPHRV